MEKKASAEKAVREIRRKTRRRFSAARLAHAGLCAGPPEHREEDDVSDCVRDPSEREAPSARFLRGLLQSSNSGATEDSCDQTAQEGEEKDRERRRTG